PKNPFLIPLPLLPALEVVRVDKLVYAFECVFNVLYRGFCFAFSGVVSAVIKIVVLLVSAFAAPILLFEWRCFLSLGECFYLQSFCVLPFR
ncbi:MAG: hypothetical protein K2N36_05515, partial [Ruminiclostridium sp.]|nr:hypothetical protein [Ruminiclostridium sp.]